MIQKLFIGKKERGAVNTFAWTASSGIIYSLQSMIFLMVYTNLMGESAAGLYTIGMTIANQMLTVGKFSVRNFQVSDIKRKYAFDEYFTFRIFTCTVSLLITLAWIFFGGYRGESAVVIFSLTVYKMAECMSDLFEGLYQQRFRFDVSGKSQFVKDLLMIIMYVSMIFITKNVMISSIILAVFSIALLFIVDLPLVSYFDRIRWNFKWKTIKELTFACAALFISSFFFVYVHNVPKFTLDKVGGGASVAVFNAVFMPVFVVDLFAGFTMRIWLTGMAVYHSNGEFGKLKRTILKQMGVITLITAVSMAGMYYLGGPVLTLIYGIDLYGHEWTNALLMLSGGMVAVYTLFENVIIICRRQQTSIIINIITAVVSTIIVPPFTRWGGIFGATVGYVIANAVRTLGYFLMAHYYINKDEKAYLLQKDG